MFEQLAIIKEHLLGIWSQKHYIILCTWLICPIAWLGIAQMPDVYESEARVYVDTQSLLRPLMKGLIVENDPNMQIRLMIKTLLSRPNLERISRMTDLDIQADNDEEYEKILDNLKEDISISTAGRENIFTISVIEKEPALAQNIVQSALTVFIENTLGETRQDTNGAQKFLNEQIQDYERRLKEAETRLKEFRQKYYGSLPEDSTSYNSHLANEQDNLKEATLALREAKTRLDSAKSQLIGEEPVFGLYSQSPQANNNLSTQFDDRITQLEEKLDELLVRFTEKHPEVKETQSRMNELKGLRRSEIDKYITASKSNPQAFSPLDENPVYQEMKIQANQLENEVASLTVRVDDYQQRVNDLKQKIFSIPEVDAEFMSLNRGYEITKSRYEDLLDRQETAQLAQDAELSTEQIQFRVIDPPKLPQEPTGPLRTLYFIGTFIISTLLGGAIAFVVIHLNPKVVSTSQLSRTTNLPIFGVVSATENLGVIATLKRKRLLFIVSNTILIFILIAFITYFQSTDFIQPQLKRIF